MLDRRAGARSKWRECLRLLVVRTRTGRVMTPATHPQPLPPHLSRNLAVLQATCPSVYAEIFPTTKDTTK